MFPIEDAEATPEARLSLVYASGAILPHCHLGPSRGVPRLEEVGGLAGPCLRRYWQGRRFLALLPTHAYWSCEGTVVLKHAAAYAVNKQPLIPVNLSESEAH